MRFLRFLPSPIFLFVLTAGVLTVFLTLPDDPDLTPRRVVNTDGSLEKRSSLEQRRQELPKPTDRIDVSPYSNAPIFSPTRLPIRVKSEPENPPQIAEQLPTEAQPSSPMPEKPSFAYLGMIKTPKRMKILLRDEKTSQETWLAIGEKFRGWKVMEISHNSIRLSKDGVIETVKKSQ